MPGIEDWKTKPYSTIQTIFEENIGGSHDDFIRKVQEYFSQRLDEESLLKIPSLNTGPLDTLRTGSLVKYRCMVQDVFDPQFCLGQYRVTNTGSQASRIECGSFRDIPNLGPTETADFEGKDCVTIERHSFYCTPIPGESDWVKKAYIEQNIEIRQPSTSYTFGRSKRDRECEGDLEVSETDQKSSKTVDMSDRNHPSGTCDAEMVETEKTKDHLDPSVPVSPYTSAVKGIDLNLPLPDEKGVPCIVRVYSNEFELKATDAVEFVGILSTNPLLASIFDEEAEGDSLINHAELVAHEPPPSLVPRIHALIVQKLHHNNPTLPPVPASEAYKQAFSRLMDDVCSLRLELLAVLEHALLCDSLAAEYLLCHLISNVYARADVLPLGKMCVNFSGCPDTQRYTKFLHHLIGQLTPQAAFLEMSIENTNSLRLIPKKDYEENRIKAGMLQLVSGTHLVIDETALQQGQLNHTGVSNVKALADLINWQKVEYDFQWHPIPVHTDIGVLTLSQGESLLPKDFHVKLAASNDILDVPAHFEKLDTRLNSENLAKLRAYITACRLINYTISDETQKVIQDDFVDTRQNNPKDMTIEDFQKLLGLVRLLTLSFGQTSPPVEMWRKARVMEDERKKRISHLSRSQ